MRGAHSASLASAQQFGIQCYALRAVNTASNVAVRVYFCRLAELPRVNACPLGGCVYLMRALLRPSLSLMLLSLPFVCPLPNVGAVKPSYHDTTIHQSADVPRRCGELHSRLLRSFRPALLGSEPIPQNFAKTKATASFKS